MGSVCPCAVIRGSQFVQQQVGIGIPDPVDKPCFSDLVKAVPGCLWHFFKGQEVWQLLMKSQEQILCECQTCQSQKSVSQKKSMLEICEFNLESQTSFFY